MMLLELKRVTFHHGQTTILRDFSLAMAPGEHRLLLGPSGSGKTTLINLIAGLRTADAGEIRIAGEDMAALPRAARDDLRRRRIGLVFQTLRLVSALSVRRNLQLAQALAGRPRDDGEIDGLLLALGLSHRAEANPRDLSQGEAQRAAVARALVARPDLLIADEPTSALDDANADRVARLLLDMAAQTGATLLVASHDARLREHIADTTMLLPC